MINCVFFPLSFLGYKFIIVTTAITNSARLIEALLDIHA